MLERASVSFGVVSAQAGLKLSLNFCAFVMYKTTFPARV